MEILWLGPGFISIHLSLISVLHHVLTSFSPPSDGPLHVTKGDL